MPLRVLPGKNLIRDVSIMGQQATAMLHEALESFDKLDAERAATLICKENELEIEFQSSLRRLATYLLEDARNVGHAIHTVLTIKSIERVGDHAGYCGTDAGGATGEDTGVAGRE